MSFPVPPPTPDTVPPTIIVPMPTEGSAPPAVWVGVNPMLSLNNILSTLPPGVDAFKFATCCNKRSAQNRLIDKPVHSKQQIFS